MGTIVVGTVLSLMVLGAVVVYLLGEWGERRQRKRELKGLLRILDTEIVTNERLLRIFDEHPDWLTRAPEHSLQSRTWEDVRVRLAYLLKDRKQFDDMARYYANIQAMEGYRLLDTGTLDEEHGKRRAKRQLSFLLELSAVARGHIRKHLPDTLLGAPPRSSDEKHSRE